MDLQNSSYITILMRMVFSKKFKFIVYFVVILLSIYIGYVLGITFCSQNCQTTIFINIFITNVVMVVVFLHLLGCPKNQLQNGMTIITMKKIELL